MYFLKHLAFDYLNRSYVEPFIEAAYIIDHPDRAELAKLYANFTAVHDTERLVLRLLDDRYHDEHNFPVHAFSLMGSRGAKIADNQQKTWLRSALLSKVPVEKLQECIELLNFDIHNIKDRFMQNILHDLVGGEDRLSLMDLSYAISRAQQLGIQNKPDIFGRFPEDLGDPAVNMVYSQYYATQKNPPLNELMAYLISTSHQFVNILSRGDSVFYTKTKTVFDSEYIKQTTLFAHVFKSKDLNIVSQLQQVQNSDLYPEHDIKKTLSYYFLEKVACDPATDRVFVNHVFAMFQEKSPMELSSALGLMAIRGHAYLESRKITADPLKHYPEAIMAITEYQKTQGLHQLIELEQLFLDPLLGQQAILLEL